MTFIAQLTTVHPRNDIRIRIKQCPSLVKGSGLPVALFVQDGEGNETDSRNGTRIVDTGPKLKKRIARMTIGVWRMWKAVRQARPTVAHFHDPELIPVGFTLKFSGVKVIYDVHEDLPRQIQGKLYIPRVLRKLFARVFESLEWLAGRFFDAIVPATPKIAERFPKHKTYVVQNFPILNELVSSEPEPYDSRPPNFAYVGGIYSERGALQMMEAIKQVPCKEAKLFLAGNFFSNAFKSKFETRSDIKRVNFLGWIGREQVASLLGKVRAGLVLFHPWPNHCSAQPNKMFEYMAAGLPVIASDFPLWREIVDAEGCGLLVDPLKPCAIAEAMNWILEHPTKAEAMGRRGRQAVEKKYNWERESAKLILLYERMLYRNGFK